MGMESRGIYNNYQENMFPGYSKFVFPPHPPMSAFGKTNRSGVVKKPVKKKKTPAKKKKTPAKKKVVKKTAKRKVVKKKKTPAKKKVVRKRKY
jgi:hypothetical protein